MQGYLYIFRITLHRINYTSQYQTTTASGAKKTRYDSPPAQKENPCHNLLIKKPNPKKSMPKEMPLKAESGTPNRPTPSIKSRPN